MGNGALYMEDERKKKVHHWYQHFKRRENTEHNLTIIRDEIERLLKWKNALSIRWSFHKHKEFD